MASLRRLALSNQKRTFHSYTGRERYTPQYVRLGGGEVSEKREEFAVSNPATGEHLCIVECASSADVRAAISSAQTAFSDGAWSKSPAIARSTVLSRLARILESRLPDLAKIETLQTGRAIREMSAQLGRLPQWLDYYAALLRTHQAYVAPTQGELLNYVQHVPLGVVAQITPFNHPLFIAVKKIAPALAAGNSVIVKPSEYAPITVLEFAKMADEAGIPPGVFAVLPGYGATTGKDIISSPVIRKVDITAGTETGRMLGGIVGSNLAAYTAELGGSAPIVVFDDADVVSAVNGVAFAAFIASGQTCVSGARIIVQDGIYDRFMPLFLEKIASIRSRMGDPLNPKSTMGSVVSQKHLDRVAAAVNARTSGTLVAGGAQMLSTSALDGFDFARGSFFPPTVIEGVEITDSIWQEEVFGPVVVVKRFSDEEEGVGLANNSKYGLGAAIWTQDLSKAHRISAALEAGICWINTHHRNDPSSPWGGMKESGIGRENGIEALESYSQSKSTIVNIATAAKTREADDWFAEQTEGKRYG